MTVRLIEGFDNFNTFPGKGWTTFGTAGSGSMSFVTGRFGAGTGTRLLLIQGNGGGFGVVKSLPASYATLVIGCAFEINVPPTPIGQRIFGFSDSGTEQFSLRLNDSNRFIVSRNGTTLATETSGGVLALTGYYLELKVTFHGSTGTYAVRRNGIAIPGIPDATGQNTISTANASANEIRLAGFESAVNASATWIDDLYVLDNAGSVNNDFLGDRRVYTLAPASNGTTIQLTNTGGASNAASVSDAAPNGDTSYVSTATAGQLDTYATGDLPAAASAINAVQFNIVARTDDATARTVAPVQRASGGTQVDGTTSESISSSYTSYMSIAETSLVTSSAWTVSEINSSEFGVKVVS